MLLSLFALESSRYLVRVRLIDESRGPYVTMYLSTIGLILDHRVATKYR